MRGSSIARAPNVQTRYTNGFPVEAVCRNLLGAARGGEPAYMDPRDSPTHDAHSSAGSQGRQPPAGTGMLHALQ